MRSFLKQFFTAALGSLFGFFAALVGLFVVVPLMIAIVSGAKGTSMEPVQEKSILELRLRGELVERHKPMDFELFGGQSLFTDERSMGLYELNKAIEFAKTDKRIVGIYLEIGAFQAGWASLSSLRRRLAEFAASGKWIIAYADRLDEMGYYLASVAGRLYMEPYGELEINGLAIQETFVKGLLAKLEVEPEIFRVGKFKAAIEPLIRDEMSKENREQTQTLVDDIWSVVRDNAAVETKLSLERIDELTSRLEVVSSESAKQAKIITDTKFVDEVESELKVASVGEENDLELVSPGRLIRNHGEKKSGAKKIAVIFLDGEIQDGESGRDTVGSYDVRTEIDDAKGDEDVAAIVLRVNSPGGDALASDVMWRAVRQADEEIPVVVSMGDVAASGGYYIASGGRYIFAESTTITGSIGVFGMMFNAQKFFKNKAGILFDKVVTHPHADIGSMARAVTPEEGKVIQAGVDRVYKRFIDVVAESRGYEKRSDIETIAEGRVWSGRRAKDLGLVDELGGLDQAIAKAAEFAEVKDYRIEILPSDIDPLRHLIERLSGEAFSQVFGSRFFGLDLRELRAAKRSVNSAKNGIYARLLYDLRIK
jgi:protease-4